MSDPYDSLEDERDNEEFSDSLESDNSKVIIGNNKCCDNTSESLEHFNTNNYVENSNCNIPCTEQNVCLERNLLPKIENNQQKGKANNCYNIIVDNEILSKQGLQLNRDGSFTKSPREDLEELPFVTREYRNLQLQKRKTFQRKIKSGPIKINRKDMFSFKENPENGISMIGLIKARGKKGSSEELLTSGESLPSIDPNNQKLEKKLSGNDNLTDSMKEILLHNQINNKFLPKDFKTSEQIKKFDRVLNLIENRKKQKSFDCVKQQSFKCNTERTGYSNTTKCTTRALDIQSLPPCNTTTGNLVQKKKNIYKPDIMKYQSDVLLKNMKPQLSYTERRQKENGFNPSSLWYNNKKTHSDTVRSVFGDSIAEKLSEISSRVLSNENLIDQDEEMFYQKIIEREKNKSPHVRVLSGKFHQDKNKSFDGTDGFNDYKLRQNNPKCKRVSKSTAIDLTVEPKKPESLFKKSNHYCSENSSSMSKTELALKAKAYGYMANARNIFKLKNQSKINTRKPEEEEETEQKNFKIKRSVLKKTLSDQCGNKSLDSDNLSNKINYKHCAAVSSRSSCKSETCQEIPKKQKSFVLPRVDSFQKLENKLKSEVLRKISSCLNGLTCHMQNIPSENL